MVPGMCFVSDQNMQVTHLQALLQDSEQKYAVLKQYARKYRGTADKKVYIVFVGLLTLYIVSDDGIRWMACELIWRRLNGKWLILMLN